METRNLPAVAPSVATRGDYFELAMPQYLIENWKVFLAIQDDSDYFDVEKILIEVKDGVATLAIKNLLLRTPLNIGDGYYALADNNRLVFMEDCAEVRHSPNLRAMGHTENIDRHYIRQLLNWTQHCRSLAAQISETATIIIDERGFSLQCDPRVTFRIPTRADPEYAVVLPFPGDPLFVDAFHLKLALCEATRYDTVVIAYERSPDSITPLFIGRDWSRCALVMPKPTYIPRPRGHG